jgi:hypothetical protein
MDSILTLISEYGLPAVLILGIAYAVLTYFYKSSKAKLDVVLNDWSGTGKNSNKTPDHGKLQNTTELIYHPLFNNAQYRIVVEIPALELCPTKPVKQQLYRDILILSTKNMFDFCKEIAKMDDQMKTWSGDKWAVEVSKQINQMITNFHVKSIEYGIPEIVLTKFARWNASTLEMLYEYVAMLGSSMIYMNNNARTNTFFLIVNILIVTTIGDAERSLKELNGEVAGQNYKGMILEG